MEGQGYLLILAWAAFCAAWAVVFVALVAVTGLQVAATSLAASGVFEEQVIALFTAAGAALSAVAALLARR